MKSSEGAELCGKLRLPCLASLGHLTADKREIKDFPKLPSATSFIRETLYPDFQRCIGYNPKRVHPQTPTFQ